MKNFYEPLLYIFKKFFNKIFQLINLLIKRFLKPFWVIFFIVIYLAAKNWQTFFKVFSVFGFPEYELVRKYIETLTSLPIIILLLAIILIFKFSNSIKTFLENSNLKQAGPIGFGQQQHTPSSKDIENKVTEDLEEKGVTLSNEQLQKIDQAFQEKEMLLVNKDKVISYLIARSELFEFEYLKLILVYNTKTALLWFSLLPSNRENFMINFQLVGQVPNVWIEKEAILNALLVNQLLEVKNRILITTEKGRRFLRHLGYNLK